MVHTTHKRHGAPIRPRGSPQQAWPHPHPQRRRPGPLVLWAQRGGKVLDVTRVSEGRTDTRSYLEGPCVLPDLM